MSIANLQNLMRNFLNNPFYIVIILFGLVIGQVCARPSLILLSQDSQSHQKVYVEIIDNIPSKTSIDIFLNLLKDFSGPLLTIIGFLIAYPILKKKLTESHITSTLNQIQETNRTVSKECQKLIDRYISLTYSNDIIRKKEIEDVFMKIKEVYYISLDASSDSATFLYLLKNTLQNTLKHYDDKNVSILTSRELYGITIETLEQVIFYCTQVVQIPKSTKTFQKSIINKRIKSFVTNSNISRYKYFNVGVIDDPKSAHYIHFCNTINSCNHSLLKRSAFQVFGNIHPIISIMYLNEVYAPVILTMKNDYPIFGDDEYRLYLIGISFRNQFTGSSTTPKKIVEITYTNPSDFRRFVGALTYDKLKNNFKDAFIDGEHIDLQKSLKMNINDIETFTLTFEKTYLSSVFSRNKSALRKKLKEK